MVDNVYPANKNIINDAYNLSWENWQTLKSQLLLKYYQLIMLKWL